MDNQTLPPGHVRACLAVICDECGYASLNELGEFLKESRANLSAWQNRNTFGPTGAVKLHDLTGASLTWLHARGGEPFPNGPKISPALQVARMYGEIREIRRVFLRFAAAVATTKQDLAAAWANELDSGSGTLFRGALLDALRNPALMASAPSAAPSAQSPAKPGHKTRKQRHA